jgi:hypothetical protein
LIKENKGSTGPHEKMTSQYSESFLREALTGMIEKKNYLPISFCIEPTASKK